MLLLSSLSASSFIVLQGGHLITLLKVVDVTNLIRVSKRKHMRFNMLLGYCIGKTAVNIKEFYILPAGDKLMQYDEIAVNTIVKNKEGEINSCREVINAVYKGGEGYAGFCSCIDT